MRVAGLTARRCGIVLMAGGHALALPAREVRGTREVAVGRHAVGNWLPERENALEHALGEPYRTPAALAGALAIGCDHGGNTWLVSLESHRGSSEVFLHDHDTDEVRPFASSLEAFALVMGVLERGDKRITPPERALLKGRVNGAVLARDFSIATMKASRFVPKSSVARRVSDARDLVAVLRHREAYPLAPVREGKRAHPSEILSDLLRLFLRGEDSGLDARLRANARHEARIVRDAVEHLRPLLAATTTTPRGDALTKARAGSLAPRHVELTSLWSSNEEEAHRLVAQATDEQAAGRHAKALAILERAIDADFANPRAWLAKCYALCGLERWEEMKRAAAFAARLASKDAYAHQQLAIACMQLEDFQGSVAASRRALELDATNASACFNLALALAELGDASALVVLERALAMNPSFQLAADEPENRRSFDRLRRRAERRMKRAPRLHDRSRRSTRPLWPPSPRGGTRGRS